LPAPAHRNYFAVGVLLFVRLFYSHGDAMNAEQAWQAALGQLQMEMPRALFDTWVSNMRFIGWEDGVFAVGARNGYARDWLENRLLSTISRLLAGMLNQSVEMRFVIDNWERDDRDYDADEHEQPQNEVQVEAV
jgi:chromosomal replication initiation ATPase DnaA